VQEENTACGGSFRSRRMASERESINFKFPKPLADALRTAARERNTTATDLVIQGLNYILGGKFDGSGSVDDAIQNLLNRIEALEFRSTDSGVENGFHQLGTQASGIYGGVDRGVDDGSSQRLSVLEQKVEALTLSLAKIEGAIAILSQRQQSSGGKRQSYNYIPPPMELQPYTGDNLARRLAVDIKTLERERKNLPEMEFESWCRSKDPRGMWWRFESDGFYHPQK